MKKLLLLFFVIFLFPLPCNAFDGPLQVRNQFPLFLPFNAPYLEKAAIETSFSAGISHSSVYLEDNSAKWETGLDMEITELHLQAKKTLNNVIEIGIDLPILSFSSGSWMVFSTAITIRSGFLITGGVRGLRMNSYTKCGGTISW
jgi:hypothetical protein